MASSTMKQKSSFYKDALPAKRSRKVGAAVLDYLLMLIVSVLFFLGANAVTEALPFMKEKEAEITGVQKEMSSLIEESKIGSLKDGSFESVETITKNYLYRLAHYSLIKGGEKEEDISPLIRAYPAITPTSDNCYYYYSSFKADHTSDYAKQENAIFGASDYITTLSKDLSFTFLYEEEGEYAYYPYLDSDTSLALQEYMNGNEKFEKGSRIYSVIHDRYRNLLENGVKEFQTDFKPYADLNSKNNEIKTSLYGVRILEFFFAYTCGSLIAYLLVPLLLKDGRTLSDKSLSLAYVKKSDGERPEFWRILVQFAFRYVGGIGTMAFLAFIAYGASSIDLIFHTFWGFLSLLGLLIFTCLYALTSFAVTFFDKEKKYTLSEFFSGIVLKDGKEFLAKKQKEETESNGELHR